MNDAVRQAWMKTFRENFLGITQEADECKVENLSAVYFATGSSKNSFYAYADSPLVIINEMLGYKIYFDLVEFTFDKTNNRTSFLGYSRYEEMGNKRRWIKARRQNYYGSTMHFYRSLVANHLKQEKFAIFAINRQAQNADTAVKKTTVATGKFAVAVPVTTLDILDTDSAAGKFYLHSSRQLMVTYDETPHSKFYLTRKVFVRGLNRFGFTAYLTFDTDRVEIDKQGIVFNPMQIIYDGFWTYERLANQLPFNYSPD